MAKPTPDAQPVDSDELVGDGTDEAPEADSAEAIAAPGPADATAAELVAQANRTEPEEIDDPDAAPQNVGYCVNPDCQVASMELWHPVTTEIPPQAEGAALHQCADMDHPHPVMCQCGQLLQPEPADA